MKFGAFIIKIFLAVVTVSHSYGYKDWGSFSASETAVIWEPIQGKAHIALTQMKCVPYGQVVQYYDEATKWAVHGHIQNHSKVRQIPENDKFAQGYWLGLMKQEYSSAWEYLDKIQKEIGEWAIEPGIADWDFGCTYTNSRYSPGILAAGCDNKKYILCSMKFFIPIIDITTPKKCDNVIHVNVEGVVLYAKNFPIRIRAIDLDTHSEEPPRIFSFPPQRSETPKLSLSGLKPFTNYKIEVMLCSTVCCCQNTTAKVEKIYFQGGPAPVPLVEFNHYPGKSECELSWNFPESQPSEDVEGFKVTIESRPSESEESLDDDTVSDKIVLNLPPNLQHRLKTLPNRRYRAYVQTKSCGRLSEKIRAEGECVTESTAPDFITSPGIMYKSGKIILRITVPKERNGPISCLFVILKPTNAKPTSTTHSSYSLRQLQRAGTNQPIIGKEYIAAAIPRNNINGPYTDVDLSQKVKSTCNVQKDGVPSNEYIGGNSGINKQWFYSIFVVSSTPGYNGANLKKSASALLPPSAPRNSQLPGSRTNIRGIHLQSMENEDAESCSSLGKVLAIIFGVILLLEIGVLAYLVKSKGAARATDEEGDGENEEEEDSEQEEEHSRRHKHKKEKKSKDKERERSESRDKEEHHHRHHRKHKKHKHRSRDETE